MFDAVEKPVPKLEAALLDARDDVATALLDLPAGHALRVACDATTRDVVTAEPIATGHKVAMRALGAGQRIRKYGEFIGRMTADAAPGAWVHSHNLATCAVRTVDDERAWRAQAAPARGARTVGVWSGEGVSPVGDRERARCYWIDPEAKLVVMVDTARNTETRHAIGAPPRAAALARDGTMIVVTDDGLRRLDPASGAVTTPAGGARVPASLRVTDAACDPRGRLWLAARVPGSAAADGALFRLDAGGAAHASVERLLAPAGIAWSIDGATLYVAESGRAAITARAFDGATGTPGAARTFADLGTMPGELGGLTVDADDHLWIALPGAGCLVRYAPSGAIERVVRLPVSFPTACAFGGDALEQLYVTTARDRLRPAQRDGEPLAGRLLAIDAGVRGVPSPRASVP